MTISGDKESYGHSNYNLEVFILYSIAALGICLNVFQSICIVIEREFRNLLSAFLIHGALINAVLASYCIVFALSLHDKSFQNACKYLGSSFIVIMTANIVNLIAIIASEIYKLNNIENNLNVNDIHIYKSNNSSNASCITFGLLIVYAASLILHLGPTVIAGNFSFDEKSGVCLFIYDQRKNYVVFVVWIVIVTLVLMASTYYLYTFHMSVNRLINKDTNFDEYVIENDNSSQYDSSNILSYVTRQYKMELLFTKSRAWTLSCVTGLHILCWYPLFFLIISDREFLIPIGLYRAFTCLAWSNSFLEPLLYILLDRKTSYCCWKLFTRSRDYKNRISAEISNRKDLDPNLSVSIFGKREEKELISSNRFQRIGDRLKYSPNEDNPTTNSCDIELVEFPKFHISTTSNSTSLDNNPNTTSYTNQALFITNSSFPDNSCASNKIIKSNSRNINYIEC